MVSIVEIKKGIGAWVNRIYPQADIIANEDEEGFKDVNDPIFIEIYPHPVNQTVHSFIRQITFYIRFHKKELSHLERLKLFESFLLGEQSIAVEDRYLTVSNLTYKEIDYVLEIKGILLFNDSIEREEVGELMNELFYEGGD